MRRLPYLRVGMRLGRPDLEGALGFVLEVADVGRSDPFQPFLLRRLGDLVGAQSVSYCEIDRMRGETDYEACSDPAPGDRGEEEAYWATVHEHPIRKHRVATGSIQAFKFHDFLTPGQLRKTEFYADYIRPWATPFVMTFGLPAPTGRSRTFILVRESRDFGERERAIVELLQPHLARARRDAELASHSALTRRETQVLGCVADGLTNRGIAELLWISPGTVRRHLDNIYSKLDVHTRTSAVRAAKEDSPRVTSES
jgi:DNA-binding CsgD family transcriptional regulator